MEKNRKYFLIALAASLIQPVLFMAGAFVTERIFSSEVWWLPVLALPVLSGIILAAGVCLPDSYTRRFLPVLLPVCLLVAGIPFACFFSGTSMRGLGFAIIVMALAVVYVLFLLSFLLSGIALAYRRRRLARREGWPGPPAAPGGRLRSILQAVARLGLLLLVSCGVGALGAWLGYRDVIFPQKGEATVGHGIQTWQYSPFREENLLAVPERPPLLRITGNYPRLDGAIAMLPVYAAAAQALYQGLDAKSASEIVRCTNTPEAYRRLADGETDIFFGLGPSAGQREYAESRGLTLNMPPLGREAFVFFVHRENPVENLSLEQIRAIYTRKVTNWKQLAQIGAAEGGGPGTERGAGGDGVAGQNANAWPDAKILAFQRPEGSGSQTAMLSMVMHGEAMMPPLREERATGMGDIVLRTADYRNRLNAVGYSFRWYATVQFAHPDIKLLSVNGVYPSPENIRNGSYPLWGNFLAVTARPQGENGEKLLEWLRGPEGQELIDRTGYVGLYSQELP